MFVIMCAYYAGSIHERHKTSGVSCATGFTSARHDGRNCVPGWYVDVYEVVCSTSTFNAGESAHCTDGDTCFEQYMMCTCAVNHGVPFTPLSLSDNVTVCVRRSEPGIVDCPLGYYIAEFTQAYYGECLGQCGAWYEVCDWIDISSNFTQCIGQASCNMPYQSSWGAPCGGFPNYLCVSAICSSSSLYTGLCWVPFLDMLVLFRLQ